MADKIAEVILYKVGEDARRGVIVFTNRLGLQFYCNGSRTLDSGATTFGGFVSPVRPDKDSRTDAEYWISFFENRNNNDVVLNIALTKVYKDADGGNIFDEEPCASGVIYASGIPGLLTGIVFKNEPKEEEPAPRKTATTKSAPKGKAPATKSAPKVDYDDIPF